MTEDQRKERRDWPIVTGREDELRPPWARHAALNAVRCVARRLTHCGAPRDARRRRDSA